MCDSAEDVIHLRVVVVKVMLLHIYHVVSDVKMSNEFQNSWFLCLQVFILSTLSDCAPTAPPAVYLQEVIHKNKASQLK